jgi:hypothetical protein
MVLVGRFAPTGFKRYKDRPAESRFIGWDNDRYMEGKNRSSDVRETIEE